MWRAQTPQAFRLPLIRDAYQRALQDPQFRATDDCGVVQRYMPGTKIHVVEGEERNRKITFNSDLAVMEKMF
jgi:2-C-methyl-D-erythritol 4-phosphate cytidylyltransferase